MASLSYWEPSGVLSPDGRWLAYFDSRSKGRDTVVFCDVAVSRYHTMDAGRTNDDSFSVRVLSWRHDSRACAVGAAGGWRIVWPATQQVKRLTHSAPGFDSCAAWSPRTGRLALFEGFLSNGLYREWNGKRLTKGIPWAKAVEYPYGEERAWQCEWSPDEKSILFRYYGHAERDRYSAGHTTVISPQTAHPRFNWGAEAGPARWLDNSRLVFEGDNGGLGTTDGLTVAKPVNGQQNIWLTNAAAWTLSARHDVIWALTTEGHLCRTRAGGRHWQVVRRKAVPRFNRQLVASLNISPCGDMAAISNTNGGSSISLVSTDRRHPWTISWRAPLGKAKVLGWAKGQSLPLVELHRSDESPGIVAQMRK